jgi:hypothetical protein
MSLHRLRMSRLERYFESLCVRSSLNYYSGLLLRICLCVYKL